MEGLSKIAEGSSTHSSQATRVSKFQEVSQSGSFKVGVEKKLEHRRNQVHKLSHSGGSNGRTFDLEDIASGSNGSHVTSTDRACRVTLTIIAAKDLKRTATGPDARDPVFKVRVEQVLRKSKDIKTGINQVPTDVLAGTVYEVDLTNFFLLLFTDYPTSISNCLVWAHTMLTACRTKTEHVPLFDGTV